jgi:hypothetical protein
MENSHYQTATQESVWAAFRETDRLIKELRESQKETELKMDKSRADFEKSSADFDRRLKESSADFDQRLKESCAEYDRRMKNYDDTMGAWARNYGSFAEEYFYNSFKQGEQTFFGERFDEIEKDVKGIEKGFKDQYDILLMNGKSVGIVEVKLKAHINDVPSVIRKAETFRINYPKYAKHQIYIGLASLSFYPDLEQECTNEGIAIIKQVGDTVVINDAHLKVF